MAAAAESNRDRLPRQGPERAIAENWIVHCAVLLVVSPIPLEAERDPNEELGHWLRTYQESHPEGKILDKTLPEQTVLTGENRRRVDRILWIGLGRLPSPDVTSANIHVTHRERQSYKIRAEDRRDQALALGPGGMTAILAN